MNLNKIKYHLLATLSAIVVVAIVYSYYKEPSKSAFKEYNPVVVPVKVAKVTEKEMTRTISAYGAIIPAPGAIDVISVPFEAYIKHVMVNNGQLASKNEPLLEIQPSQNAYLSLSEAEASYRSAKRNYEHMQEMLDMKLATNDQYLTAELVFKQAELRLENLKSQGIEKPRKIYAHVDGLVKAINVKQGAIVPAGTSLIEIISSNHFEVNFGIEAQDLSELKIGQNVTVFSVYHSPALKVRGTIRQLSYEVNPSSNLVDIFVTTPSPSPFLLGEIVFGELDLELKRGLIVPSDAILFDGEHYSIFTERNGRAVKHEIQVVLVKNNEYLIESKTVKSGENLVISGNYELSEGMQVSIGE